MKERVRKRNETLSKRRVSARWQKTIARIEMQVNLKEFIQLHKAVRVRIHFAKDLVQQWTTNVFTMALVVQVFKEERSMHKS